MNNLRTNKSKKEVNDKPCVHPKLIKHPVSYDKICSVCGRLVYSGKSSGHKTKRNN
jgi:hypothetical protein